jgi:hypothetical protein
MTATPTYVGIDVAKNRLDIAMRPSGECQQVGNDERGIRYVVTRLCKVRPTLVILEATGWSRTTCSSRPGSGRITGRSRQPPPGAGLC